MLCNRTKYKMNGDGDGDADISRISETSENIKNLKENEIFVFGSNEAGRHGRGAAKTALQWGAQYYNAAGLQGNTYALPTKDRNLRTLPLTKIQHYIEQLEAVIGHNPDKHFLITEIGCGLAGYKAEEIAPLFRNILRFQNISLPKKFLTVLAASQI